MTLEEVLKANGYSDAELVEMKPMLSNAKFRTALEKQIATMETQIAKTDKELNDYDEWFTKEITPQHEKLLKEHEDAKAEAAAAKERLAIALKRGRGTVTAEQEAADTAAAAAAAAQALKDKGVDPTKFVTTEVFQDAFNKTGEAISGALDIVTDFQQLYPGQYINMSEIMQQARAARKPVRQFVEEKYKFTEKRAEMVAKAAADKEAAIRKEEREKVMVEFAGSNPNMQTLSPSANPFVIRKKTNDGKQPWERTAPESARERMEKAVKAAAGRGELVGT